MSGYKNMMWQNIGSLKNTGFEASISWKAVQTKDWFWQLDYNFTYNKNEITDLEGVSSNGMPVETGPNAGGGTGNYVQAHISRCMTPTVCQSRTVSWTVTAMV